MEQISYKPYKKGAEYSYTLGAFPTFELINARPEIVLEVLVHSTFTEKDKLYDLCKKNQIKVTQNDKLISKLSDKENVFVIGILKKYTDKILKDKPHVVLVSPSNMGNLGTILRTCLGFGIKDIAIIGQSADLFSPKTIRSSMGAEFRLRIATFDDFSSYQKEFKNHEIFTFMLTGKNQLTVMNCPKPKLYSLVFGNEATGLPAEYETYGTSIIIPQTNEVDSLNLTIAVGIGTYMFTQSTKENA